MAAESFEWSEVKWNPTAGCSKVSEGCEHCYAEESAEILKRRGNRKYRAGFEVTAHWGLLNPPYPWPKTIPRRVFVVSMGDLFHDRVPFEFIRGVWDVMLRHPIHSFHLLTKRPLRALSFAGWLQDQGVNPSAKWIKVGVTAENQRRAEERIPILLEIPAAVHFVSVEPMLEPVDLRRYLPHLDWVACGAESGGHARRMDLGWARSLRDQCAAHSVNFFFMKPSAGDASPLDLQIRQYAP